MTTMEIKLYKETRIKELQAEIKRYEEFLPKASRLEAKSIAVCIKNAQSIIAELTLDLANM